MLDLTTFHSAINNIAVAEPIFIYVGVGAAAGLSVQNPGLGQNPGPVQKLSPEQYQQFPPFLQDVRNKIPNVNLFLLLIDPMQENPPCVAIDYNLAEDTKDNYKSEDGRLQAFVYRELVYTDVDINPAAKAVNMTQNLRDLNNLAKEKGASLLYHNFTGRNTATLLAEHFDTENLEHLDQIIYSLSAREDHGCFFDLTQPNATFPFRLAQAEPAQAPAAQAPAAQAPAAHQKRPIIKMFNFYKYIANNCYEKMAEELEEYPAEMRPLEEVQRNQIINNIRNQFKNVNLSILRHVRNLIFQQAEPIVEQGAAQSASEAAAALAGPEVYLFNDIPHLYREIFSELYKEQDFSLLYELMFNYCASELNIFAHLKKMAMTGEELLTFITMEEDPYKWYNNIAIML
jgi:hypothetical protein